MITGEKLATWERGLAILGPLGKGVKTGAKLAKFSNEAIGTATKVVDRSVKALGVADNTATYGRMAARVASDGVGAVATDVAQMLLTGAGSAFLAKQAAKLGDQTIKKGLGVIGGVTSNANRRNNRSSGGGTDSPTKQSAAYAGTGGKGEDPKKDSGASPPKTTTGYSGDGTGGNGAKGTGEVERAAGGMRQSALREITDDEATFIKNEFAEIGGDPKKLSFNTGRGTSYVDRTDMINVRGDIFPVGGEIHPRSIMSERAVLAHEYYGHGAYRGTSLKPGAWNDEFRASYMAAKNAPNLSKMDRIHLIQDAMARAQEAGIPIKMNNFMREILYGY